MNIKWRKINRIFHRDLGYLFFGMTIIYALSGIAVNHLKDWNPNYIVKIKEINLGYSLNKDNINKEQVLSILSEYDEGNNYKKYYFPRENTLKIFLRNGSAEIDINTGIGKIEKIKKRQVFNQVNYLHYNPVKWWTVFSDIFSGSLIIIAITGLFVLKGKKGITGRGAWLTAIGLLIPIIFLIIFN